MEGMNASSGSRRRRRDGWVVAVIGGLLGVVVTMLVTITTVMTTSASAATTGSWTLTGNMSGSAQGVSAIPLPNGDVLVTLSNATPELYNPTTGTWQATGSMTTGRSFDTTTLLPDGEVLAAGGENAGNPLASAELYNPTTGTWRLTGSMATPRLQQSAALLSDGDVLVAGGENDHGNVILSEAELYDPSTGTWQTTGSMNAAGYDQTMIGLQNGTALVFGGMTSPGGTTPPPEIYNPITQSWQNTGNLLYGLSPGDNGATATLLSDGDVLVAGGAPPGVGFNPSPASPSAELYDPTSGTWQAAASMNVARANAAAAVLSDGTVLMTGGYELGGYPGVTGKEVPPLVPATTEIYNPSTNTWTLGSDMNVARFGQVAATLSNGTVLVAGGVGSSDTALSSAEIYTPGGSPLPAPAVTGISPNSGPATGGTPVTITGTNLTGGSVSFGSIAATGVNCSTSSCSATSPAGSSTVDVTVTTTAGTSTTSSADQFTYQSAPPPPAPTITSISPTSGTTAGGTPVIITGTNLSGATAVKFGSTAATVTADTATLITATTPTGSAGAVNVSVTTPGGTVADAAAYTYVAPAPAAPTMASISPTSGTTAGGTSVTITGKNLASASAVKFGTSAAATFTINSATSITATTPVGSAGAVNVSVTTPGGTVTDSAAYTYVAPVSAPTITSISPTSGTTAGGISVTITGTNLSGATAVKFGTSAANFTVNSASSITATTPAGSAGAVNVSVTTPGGTVTDTAAYTYVVAGSSSNLIPDPGFETAGVPADIWGSTLARSQTVVHSGSWSLAQTATSTSGGWDLDSNVAWCAPITSTKTYTASIWVRATATAQVDLNVDLLTSKGNYVNSVNGPTVTLAANAWTQLSITGIKVTSGEVLAGMEPNFAKATKGSTIYWDDMSLTTP